MVARTSLDSRFVFSFSGAEVCHSAAVPGVAG